MTPRQLRLVALAFGALILLWGAAALLGHDRDHADSTLPLGAIARDQVDTVRVARPRDTTILVRRDSAAWTVNGHPADRAAVSELLAALADSVRRGEPVAQRRASHARLGVDSTAGTRVRIAGRAVNVELVLGQRTPDLTGGYARMAGDSGVYLLRGPLPGLLGRGTDDWRDRRIAGVTPDSVATIEIGRRGRDYRLARREGGWRFVGGGAADSVRVQGLLEGYRLVEAAGFATPAQADSARFDRPDRRVRLLGADGAPLLGLAFDSTATGYWVRSDSADVVYRLDWWTADRLAPADSTLRPGRPSA